MTELTTILDQQLAANPTRRIIKDEGLGTWFSGADLAEDVATLQQAFAALGLGHGSQVLVCLPNAAVFPVINQAAWHRGIIVHPISPSTPVAELEADWRQHGYPVMLVTPTLAAAWSLGGFTQSELSLNTFARIAVLAQAARPAAAVTPVADDDLALILNTSGTTGKPKRVGLTHAMLLNAARYDAASNEMTDQDVAMITMPMFHINAQVMSTLSSRIANARIVVTPRFSASRFWDQVADNGVTWVSVVPTIVSFLLLNEQANAAYQRLQDRIHLRYVRSSSFALPEERLREFQDRFDTLILEGYGMTEAASQCTINPFTAPKIGSAGKPYGTEVRIVGTDGQRTTAAGVMGEITIRGDHVITRYMDPNPDSFQDGWFLTGDLGYFDEDGYLFVKGRKKEIISRGGEKVAPAAVENVLNELDFIEQLAVIGMPDDLYGEAVCAVVVSTTPGVNEDAQRAAIFAYAKTHLAKFESPTEVRFVREFPRNITGKVLRPALQAQLLAATV
ncbi:AMP-binding protein [Lacticaseibacillus parakribbianus]|uniref:AMP-binding protein n=1 Tax=Lacticaseibacillus parakribbianus TaxID=2970927 RepID=UPI0021CB5A97|nr:AMP-binding protein [Lacticaseibacillus parakribbianus]